jgi:hypothetical protein
VEKTTARGLALVEEGIAGGAGDADVDADAEADAPPEADREGAVLLGCGCARAGWRGGERRGERRVEEGVLDAERE